jgi:tol-pal system protein YbgF
MRDHLQSCLGWLALTVALATVLPGCVAQQADLKQTEQNLHKKIKQSNEELAQSRARQGQEISSIREQELPKIQGDLDKALHQTKVLEARQDDLQAKFDSRMEKRGIEQDKRAAELDKRIGWVEKQLVDQDAQLRTERERLKTELEQMRTHLESVQKAILDAVQTTTGNLTKKIEARMDEQQKAIHAGDTRSVALNQQVEKLNHALGDYKQALTGLGEKMVRQEEATSQLSTSLSKRMDASAAHINEVSKSVASVAKSLETAGSKFMTRIDEQDRRLDDLSGQLRNTSNPGQRQQNQKSAHRSAQAPSPEPSKPAHRRTEASTTSAPEAASDSEVVAVHSPTESPAAIVPAAESERADRAAYERVLTRFRDGDMEQARQGFAAFLADYPDSELAPNARYWLGESYYGKKDFRRAIDSYDRVELDYPQSEKVPAALLKKGFAYLALKDHKRASSAFKQVVTLYPKSPEAGKASDKLSQLKESR